MEPIAAPIEAKSGINLFFLCVVLLMGSHATNSDSNWVRYFISSGVVLVSKGLLLSLLCLDGGSLVVGLSTFIFST